MNSTASSPQTALPSFSALAEENALLREQLDAQSDAIRQLKHQLDWFKKQLFGPKSEKQVFDLPQQGHLFSSDQAVVSAPPEDEKRVVQAYQRGSGKKQRPVILIVAEHPPSISGQLSDNRMNGPGHPDSEHPPSISGQLSDSVT